MKNLLCFAMLMFCSTAFAQESYPDQDLTNPILGTDYGDGDIVFPLPDGSTDYFTNSIGKGIVVGNGGTAVITIDPRPDHTAFIRVNLKPNQYFGPIYGVVGMVAVHVISPTGNQTFWYPVGYSAWPYGALTGWYWDTTVTLPPMSYVIVSFTGSSFGISSAAVTAGLVADVFIP